MFKLFLTSCIVCVIIVIYGCSSVDSSVVTPKLKIKEFIKHNSSLTTEQANTLADRFIVHGYERAKWLAATAKVESDFRVDAVGKSGEVSMFQILKWPKGKNPKSIDDSIDEALKVLSEKEKASKTTFESIRRYNGNPRKKQTLIYANKVSNYMRYL